MVIKPILLFGLPRSGTTWIGKVFDSHPATLYRHEPDSGGALDTVLPLLPDVQDSPSYAPALNAFIDALPANRSLRITGKLPVFPKAYHQPLGFALRRGLLLGGKAAGRWISVPPLPEFIRGSHREPVYLTWKSIESLGRLGVFARAVPNARAVHIMRHPCGYVASVLSGEAHGLLPGAVPASEDYGIIEMLLETAPARRAGVTLEQLQGLQPVERLAWRWRLFNEKALEDLAGLDNAHTVLYEDLCEAPVAAYRKLFEFAQLPWHPQTEAFVSQSTQSERAAYFSVFKDPKRAAWSWREKLSTEDQALIMATVADSPAGALYQP